jgi:LacI family transcriptional regulator
MISEITNPFFPELIQGFEEIAERHGYDIWISSTSRDPARQPRGFRVCEVSRPPS